MDQIDKKILHCLQKNSRISNQELADQVALSPSPCLRRVKQLEEKGFIKNHVTLLDPKKLGLNLTIMVSVGLHQHDLLIMRAFEEAVALMSEVIGCFLIAGQEADYLLKVVSPDMESFQVFLLEKLSRLEGVDSIRSSFVLQNIFDKTALPLDYLQ